MSTANFNPADRIDLKPHCAGDRIRLMARSGGYVMVRKPRCMPFVLSEKEWAKLPLYTDLAVKMLVDDDWLRRKVETDPDLDCEAS